MKDTKSLQEKFERFVSVNKEEKGRSFVIIPDNDDSLWECGIATLLIERYEYDNLKHGMKVYLDRPIN